MSSAIRPLLAQNGNRIRLLEAHDVMSREIIRNVEGDDGEKFHGFWISGLTQTTYMGIPDTELISPLQRATAMAGREGATPTSPRNLCAAFDADSGGALSDIPNLVRSLAVQGVSMIIIEDKYVPEPGNKVNSLADMSNAQQQADPAEFGKTLKAFHDAADSYDMMITARIETFTTRVVLEDEAEERASAEAALEDALHRARVYRDSGADAIMIHSKSKSPNEVLEFLTGFRADDKLTTLVVVPTTYGGIGDDALYNAGANVIIYANHLMRAKIQAITSFSERFLQEKSPSESEDREFEACIKTKNFGYLLRVLLSRESLEEVQKWYRILAERYAFENMARVANCLLNGRACNSADRYIIPVKDLLKINAHQLASKDLAVAESAQWGSSVISQVF